MTRKSYFIDADEIAKHADELIDATDILKKLRPDMICGRSCSPLQAAGAATKAPVRKCPTLAFQPRRTCPAVNDPNPSLATNVWVNGVWIRSIATDTLCQIGRRGMLAGLLPGSMQVLCEIQPEHIEQIAYADEFNTTVGKPHSDSAIYIVLKQGVAYQPGANIVRRRRIRGAGQDKPPRLARWARRTLERLGGLAARFDGGVADVPLPASGRVRRRHG